MPPTTGAWHGIILGAFIAFYAFIGFEDMVNVAEDVKEPRRNMPRAIFLTVVCSILPYMIVASAVVHTVASVELALHGAPLTACLPDRRLVTEYCRYSNHVAGYADINAERPL